MSRLHRQRTARSSAFALLVSTFLLAAARADEPGFQPIFNGKDLTGWRLGKTDLAGKTASDDGRFAVKDGVLVITGSKDTPPKMTEIDTVESYDGDFTLRLEFRASRDANSGLHLRDKAFAHQLQIRDYPRVGPYKTLKDYKDGDWNAIEVVVTGTKARCTCNGELLEAALEIPADGPLALQSETNVVEYRNIRIKREDAGPGRQTRHPLRRPGARAPGARCLFAARGEEPARRLLDSRRRLADGRQDRASRSSRRRSWTRGSSSSPPTTGSCRTSTWGPSCATSPSPSAGCTTTSPSTAAIRSGSSSWAIPPARSSPR